MIAPNVKSEILHRLAATEKEHDVRVLFAIESGSRAWGFASPDSDYDVRFIYVRPTSWYLSIDLEERRDVIEYPIVDDIDLNGWDLRKALRLFAKSNPTFVEWLQSPIVYIENGTFATKARDLLPVVYSYARGIQHYKSMAKTTYHNYLQSDLVRLKKYFYALRPLLSVHWLERYGSPPPIEFTKLLHLITENQLLDDIKELLKRKRAAPEIGLAAQVLSIQKYIELELVRLDSFSNESVVKSNAKDAVNELFREVLQD